MGKDHFEGRRMGPEVARRGRMDCTSNGSLRGKTSVSEKRQGAFKYGSGDSVAGRCKSTRKSNEKEIRKNPQKCPPRSVKQKDRTIAPQHDRLRATWRQHQRKKRQNLNQGNVVGGLLMLARSWQRILRGC